MDVPCRAPAQKGPLTAMQIRLTVLGPHSGRTPQSTRGRDVLVTAPAGTALSAVASALAASAGAPDGPVVLFSGTDRIDPAVCLLGEPPLVDGAVLALQSPVEPAPSATGDSARLHVIAGPDAGGVHLLHGGRITIGRSADADVPLDDPDVSRLHCEVTVTADGLVSVADLNSTNGTTVDGTPVTDRPVRFAPGAVLRVGESTLRLGTAADEAAPLPTAADGEGHVRVGADTSPALSSDGAGSSGRPLGGRSAAAPSGRRVSAGMRDAASGAESRVGSGRAGRPLGGGGSADTGASGPGSAYGAGADGDRGARARGAAAADAGARAAGSGGTASGARAGQVVPDAGSQGVPRAREAGEYGGRGVHSGPAEQADLTSGSAEEDSARRTASGTGDGPRARAADTADPGTPSPQGVPLGEFTPGEEGPEGRPEAAHARGGARSRSSDTDSAHEPWHPAWAPYGAQGSVGDGTGTAGGDLRGHLGAPRAVSPTDPDRPDGAASPEARPHVQGAPAPRTPDAGQQAPSGGPFTPQAPGTRHEPTAGPLPMTDGRTTDGRAPRAPQPGPSHPAPDTPDQPVGDALPHGATVRGFGGTPGSDADAPHADTAAPDEGADLDPASRRSGTPMRGTTVPRQLRRRGLTAWARRLTGSREVPVTPAAEQPAEHPVPDLAPAPAPEAWPDPATLLLTALGPGPRLWERGPAHPEALAVRLGTSDRTAPGGTGLLPGVPVTVSLREAGALGLAGPRERLDGLARSVVAQLAALHAPGDLEIVLISTDRARGVEDRTDRWGWLGWLPHLRPAHGQDCRLLLAYDREQAAARAGELLRRLDDLRQEAERTPTAGRVPRPTTGPETTGEQRPGAAHPAVPQDGHAGSTPTNAHRTPLHHTTGQAPDPYDGQDGRSHPHARVAGDRGTDVPGSEPASPTGPFTVVLVDGDPGSAALREAVTRLATDGPAAGVHVVCLAETPPASAASPVSATYDAAAAASPAFRACGAVALLSGDVATTLRLLRATRDGLAGHGTLASVDAVSTAWAERFARALAPLRAADTGERHARASAPLPQSTRLLDELGLARATPASLMARWAAAADDPVAPAGRAWAVLGAGPRGPLCADLAGQGPHLFIEGPAGSGRTELLRTVAAALASTERPDRLGIILVDGAGTDRGDGLRACLDLPHVTTRLVANDPVHMREFAQALVAELKRRSEFVGRLGFADWHAERQAADRMVAQRIRSGAADLDAAASSTLRLRAPDVAPRDAAGPPLPRLVVLVDDIDALVAPALGAPGRPAAGSVVRALDAVAREGERLGVHLVAASARPERTADTEFARAALRVRLETPASGPEDPAPGRGTLTTADGRVTAFQAGRVSGRIPRTSTLRPTAAPLEWERMGDPPTRRPVRELGNGPTDLALLASAVERAGRSVNSDRLPPLL
ncbi:ESX-1 secretion system protein EccCa1 [Streptomyces sp. YIM 130001]|uniref:FtsK/SpoIIIE domain-containing protein n=1 Tax=Streptomyces sp. YIM 130001 TaxID=2259644 RepID=UPI000ED69949|nr:FtsK/SpoIIIE domain-containing protein [Streptomyces sp. YIM 130001]RII19841.1 ESX-1 secretion system protein EccCa1 [Streptomyces sp. YIM 130001]